MTTSISWVFHRFCKSARSARRQREKKMERLHIDGSATYLYGKIGVKLSVCPVNKNKRMMLINFE